MYAKHMAAGNCFYPSICILDYTQDSKDKTEFSQEN